MGSLAAVAVGLTTVAATAPTTDPTLPDLTGVPLEYIIKIVPIFPHPQVPQLETAVNPSGATVGRSGNSVYRWPD